VMNDHGLQLDFMPSISGFRRFESLRSRATEVEFGRHRLLVASLSDIIKSKRAAARPKDLASLPALEAALEEEKKQKYP
jgi:hypothetical protein